MEEPGGLLSVGSQRIRHDWSDLAAAAAADVYAHLDVFLNSYSCLFVYLSVDSL